MRTVLPRRRLQTSELIEAISTEENCRDGTLTSISDCPAPVIAELGLGDHVWATADAEELISILAELPGSLW